MTELVAIIGQIVKNEFLLGVCASLIAAALFPPISEIGCGLLAKVFGWLPVQSKTNLSACTWRSTWHVQSTHFPPEVTDEAVKIRQLGNRVFMKFKNGSLEFVARGVIDNGRYVTGTWRDRTEDGYHGAFQLVIDPATKNMSGKWIGFSTQDFVKEGLWVWTRNAQPIISPDAAR